MRTSTVRASGLKLKVVTWLVLSSFLTPYTAALATPDERDQVRGEILAQVERQFELETPGIGESLPDRMLEFGGNGAKENLVEMLTDLKMGVLNAGKRAWYGDGTLLVMGAPGAWRLLKKFGKSAGIHFAGSIRLVEKGKEIGHEFAEQAKDVADLAVDRAESTAEAWRDAADDIKDSARMAREFWDAIDGWGGENIADAGHDWVEGIKDSGRDANRWARAVGRWTKEETKDAASDLTSGTWENLKATGRWTKRVGKFFIDETVDSFTSVNRWSKAAWEMTKNRTSKTWEFTTRSSSDILDGTHKVGSSAARWLNKNWNIAGRQGWSATKKVWAWNKERGWDKGIKGGYQTGANAWNHGDKLMGTIWTITGAAKGVFHLVLLEPITLPFTLGYAGAGTLIVPSVGYPTVGAIYAGGALASGLTFVAGSAATGAIAVGGTALTVGAGAAGVVRGVGTAAVGTVATTGAGALGLAGTTAKAGIDLVRTVGTPVVGGLGIAGSYALGGAEMLGHSLYQGTRIAGVSALTAAGDTVVGGLAATRILFNVVQGAGVTVFDNAIVTPIGTVYNLAQAVASGVWTLVEDPLKGTLNVVAMGGVVVGALVTSGGVATYELVKGLAKGLGHGVLAVGHSGIWIVGAVAKTGEVAWRAVNVPEHRRYARFRKDETQEIFDRIKEDADHELATRFGEIYLIRTHVFGDDRGRVRFFLTKNKETKERFYFKRAIDPANCEITYSVTNMDPLVRAFTSRPWLAEYRSGLFRKGCTPEQIQTEGSASSLAGSQR